MITYKINKQRLDYRCCSAKYCRYCGKEKINKVNVFTKINCSCCNKYHHFHIYLCDKHVENVWKHLPKEITLTLSLQNIIDPIPNLYMI
jgi:hypothetical protein